METLTNSRHAVQDSCFQGLIREWAEAREWDWVKAANIMYGHVLEERERAEADACTYCEVGDGHPEGTFS
jgi:hypothetical protein